MQKISKGEISFLIKPVIILGSVVILFIVLSLIGYNQISALVTSTNTLKSTQSALNKKILVLQNVDEQIFGDTTFLDVVIPSRASVLYGLSQIKNEAAKNNLIVSNVKTGALITEKDDVSKVSITFDADGNKNEVFTFLKSFSKVLPLMTLEKIKISGSDDKTSATTTVNVYSASLPKTIPSLETPTNSLTAEETKILKELTSYSMPVFAEPKQQDFETKEDPFN